MVVLPFLAPLISTSASSPVVLEGSTKSCGVLFSSIRTFCGISKVAFVFVKSTENAFPDTANPPFVAAVYVPPLALSNAVLTFEYPSIDKTPPISVFPFTFKS